MKLHWTNQNEPVGFTDAYGHRWHVKTVYGRDNVGTVRYTRRVWVCLDCGAMSASPPSGLSDEQVLRSMDA